MHWFYNGNLLIPPRRQSSRKLYEYSNLSRILTCKRHYSLIIYRSYRKLFSHYEITGFSNKPFQVGYDINPGNFLEKWSFLDTLIICDVTKPPLTVLKSSKARKGNNMFNLTVLSWLFPTEEGAKIPHSSVICFGDEISYCQSGMIRKKFSGKFAEDTITSLIEFDNVLGMDCRTVIDRALNIILRSDRIWFGLFSWPMQREIQCKKL